MIPDYDQTIKFFDDGDVVTGEVVKIDKDEVLVDIGYKSEGAIPLRELSIRSDANPHDIVKIGDKIDALVLQKEDKDGRLILSKKRAEYEKAWIDIEKIAKEGTPLEGCVIEVVKGGLILDIGLRGFLPASLVDLRRVKDLAQYIGSTLECKIIEMDRHRNNVVLSRRAVLEEARKQEKHNLLSTLAKGQVLTGKVSSIVDFGAFVDLGGIDGLIHISELCWEHVDHPSEVVNVGDDVSVQVLDVDIERERISLGLKQTQDDPWRKLVDDFNVGDLVEGTITKLVPFGAFVQITDGVEGLVHISEMADRHVELPEQVAKVGDAVSARVVGIDLERHRISLSIKQASEPSGEVEEEVECEEAAAPEAEVAEVAEAAVPEAAETEAAETVEEVAEVEVAEAVEEVALEEEVIAEGEVAESEVAEPVVAEEVTAVETEPAEPGSLEDFLADMKAKNS
ncbi:MAG: 30S ribosomal protein S1 [Chloroflexi bacterium]|nr:30S ribosomal protein S1 [Chloroflexota bacterium]